MWKFWFAPISWDENPAFQIRSSWAKLSRLERFQRLYFSITYVFSVNQNIPTPPASTIFSPLFYWLFLRRFRDCSAFVTVSAARCVSAKLSCAMHGSGGGEIGSGGKATTLSRTVWKNATPSIPKTGSGGHVTAPGTPTVVIARTLSITSTEAKQGFGGKVPSVAKDVNLSPGNATFLDLPGSVLFPPRPIFASFGQHVEVHPIVTLAVGAPTNCLASVEVYYNFNKQTTVYFPPVPCGQSSCTTISLDVTPLFPHVVWLRRDDLVGRYA
jgi:hypothetical protein